MRTSNTSGLNAIKKNPKYSLVRSSMFNKNPIFDKMDVHMLNINDDESDRLSIGVQSHMPKQRGIGRDYFSVIGGARPAATDETDRISSKTLNVRSMSTKRIKPVNYDKPSWKEDKNALRAQSLQFNKGLSYVMIKGKV